MAMIEIARFHTPIEADLARARLDAAGIEVLLLDHNLSSAFGGAMMPSRLMVLPEDEAEARALLAA
ncbi:DUF2007 domain-containing protein [Pacificimonas sp. WHA3]|uniref:DUF2007 domain-containing protein n=1 Tax=Pacificimonas pallii TaxID=2827236 RepID=A0ABS6SBZ4_9SPHN|nr:DUF2007 domain-containing protein [Pacificimonas pallii]MBV7255943.1 DUF2007 domain-containing protein [Pacificimonas pallii]